MRFVRWGLRGAILVLLALAFVDPPLPGTGPRLRVYLIDASTSAAKTGTDGFTPDDALRLARHDAAALRPEDRVAIVAFGAKPVVLLPPSPAGEARMPVRIDGVDGSSTDLAAAVETAAALAEGGEIVLFSDGRSTGGRVPLERIRVPVHPFPLGPVGGVDASIQALDAPAAVPPGGEFSVRVTVEATGSWSGAVSGPGDPRRLEFSGPGRQDVVFPTRMPSDGRDMSLEFRLGGAAPDPCSENDSARATVFAETRAPRVLIVGPDGATSLAAAFREPRWIPMRAPDLGRASEADVILIERLRAEDVPAPDLERLADLVTEGGAGLVMMGGSSGFALGGWGGTPVEDLLPFWAFPDERSAVVIALDRSGSMAEPAPGRTRRRLEEAASAVRRALQLTHDEDEVALVTFAESAELRCPLVAGRDRGRAASAIEKLTAGGPTVLATALDLAASTVRGSKAGRRHLLLITDGRSVGEESALRAAAQALREDGIGLTIVRLGDSSTPALAILRDAGATEIDGSDAAALDDRVAGALARSRELTMEPSVGLTFLGTLAGLLGSPKPARLNRVTLKSGAEVLSRAGEAPAAALRGRAAAATFAFEEGWIGGLETWAGRSELVTRLAEAVAPRGPRLEADVAHRFENDRLEIVATLRGTDRPLKLEVTVDGAPLTLPRRGENRYQAVLDRAPDSAAIRIGGRIAGVARRPHAAEFDRVGPDMETLGNLAQATGGTLLSTPRDLSALPGRAAPRPRSGRPLFLAAALILFLADVALGLFRPR